MKLYSACLSLCYILLVLIVGPSWHLDVAVGTLCWLALFELNTFNVWWYIFSNKYNKKLSMALVVDSQKIEHSVN